jgi:hypothetical protein
MEICLNLLIEWLEESIESEETSEEDFLPVERVLYFNELDNEAIVINIFDRKGFPFLRSFSEIRDAILSGNANVWTKDPFDYLRRSDKHFSEKSIKHREDSWKDFEKLIDDKEIELMLDRKVRGKKVNELREITGRSKTTINDWLRSWWQSGREENALLPDFDKCGGKGKRRLSDNPDGPKLGRPPRNYDEQSEESNGGRITPAIERKFERGVKKFYETDQCRSLAEAFDRTKEKYFCIGKDKIDGVRVPVLPPDNQLPSYMQFWFWYRNHYRNPKREKISREGEIEYLKNSRPITGDSTQMAFGPGSLLQFDSTIANVHLVNSLMPDRIVGRAVVYLGIDTFSHAIPGFAALVEGPSWKGAMIALDNVTTNKVEFCAKYGITIDEDEWPMHHVFEGILADRGEMKGYKAEPFLNIGVKIQNTSPYRADMKGLVERHHGIAEQKIVKFLPGYVPHIKERGEPDYILDASLTLNDFRKLWIDHILEYNELHHMKGYKKNKFMIVDYVKRYPLDIWNWGIRHRSGHLRAISQDIIRLNLLPRKTIAVTPRGIHLEGELYYVSDLILREGWLDRAKGKSMRVEVAYYPDSTDVIYLPLNGGTRLEVCHLTQASQHLKDCSWYDAVDYFALEYQAEKVDRTKRQRRKAIRQARKENIVSNAVERRQNALLKAGKTSKKSRKESIRLNREMEKLADNPLGDWHPSLPSENASNGNINTTNGTAKLQEEYIPRPSHIDALRKLQEDTK